MSTYTPLLIRVDRRSTPSRNEGPSLEELLNVSSKTAWRTVQKGLVECRKIMGRRMVLLDSVAAYLDIDADELGRLVGQATSGEQQV